MAKPPLSLLLSVLPGELAGLARNPPPGWVCATTGAGSSTASAATSRILCALRPARVVMIGTCATFDSAAIPIFSLVGVASAVSNAPDELRWIAHRPIILEQTRWEATVRLPFTSRAVVVTSGPAMDPSAGGLPGALGQVEHREMAGVFASCQGAGTPFGGGLVVTDQVGPNAKREYLANRDEATRRLVQALLESGFFET